MRKWIEYIMNYSPAYEDFNEWVGEVQNNLGRGIIRAARAGNTEKVNQLAVELAVYDSIREKFQGEFKEMQSQSAFNQNKE